METAAPAAAAASAFSQRLLAPAGERSAARWPTSSTTWALLGPRVRSDAFKGHLVRFVTGCRTASSGREFAAVLQYPPTAWRYTAPALLLLRRRPAGGVSAARPRRHAMGGLARPQPSPAHDANPDVRPAPVVPAAGRIRGLPPPARAPLGERANGEYKDIFQTLDGRDRKLLFDGARQNRTNGTRSSFARATRSPTSTSCAAAWCAWSGCTAATAWPSPATAPARSSVKSPFSAAQGAWVRSSPRRT